MLTERFTASAIGARTARACGGCMIRRARWFCASDDAFLCHSCDASVHLANQLASRHERVLISSATADPSKPAPVEISVSDWHQKVTRRSRTPRSNGAKAKSLEMKEASSLVVPEIGFEEELSWENDEDLMVFQVPVFYADCGFWNEDESASVEELHSLLHFVSDDIRFSAGDDEWLIGGAGANFVCGVELEMLDCIKGKKMDVAELESEKNMRVKMEDDEDADEIEAVLASKYDTELIDSGSRESLLDWDFGFESDEMVVKEEEGLKMKMERSLEEEVAFGKRLLQLKLNCDEVVSVWDDHGCPWMNGIRPVFDPLGDGWPQFSGIKDSNSGHGNTVDENGGRSVSDRWVVSEERVARVTRYREKRRTRLFSKKIRYEVRKLNAEKRPRMKGQFCKRVQSYVGSLLVKNV